MNKLDAEISSGISLDAARLNPRELTHKQLEAFLSEGRRRHSAYVVSLLNALWRRLCRGGSWVAARIDAGKRANRRPENTRCLITGGKS